MNESRPDQLLIDYLQALIEKSNRIEEEDIDVYCKFYEEVKQILERYANEYGNGFIKEKLDEFPSIDPAKYRKPVRTYRYNHVYAFNLFVWYLRMIRLKGDASSIAGISNSIITVLDNPVWKEMLDRQKK